MSKKRSEEGLEMCIMGAIIEHLSNQDLVINPKLNISSRWLHLGLQKDW